MNARRIPTTALTSRERCQFVYDGKRRIGSTIALSKGKFAAWSPVKKIGEFATLIAAERAVWAEHRRARS